MTAQELRLAMRAVLFRQRLDQRWLFPELAPDSDPPDPQPHAATNRQADGPSAGATDRRQP